MDLKKDQKMDLEKDQKMDSKNESSDYESSSESSKRKVSRCANCFLEKSLSQITKVNGENICADCFDDYVKNLDPEEKSRREEIVERLKRQGAKDFTTGSIKAHEIKFKWLLYNLGLDVLCAES
ncbi:hypothetical protein MHBO_004800 [Bonamia ostreae]|uniref:ClpX-type ZB domain-containing protein n=1 Tax=Bonamia ostreae TaxID=126728 RepID=A0ABV2AUB3_9EUKA